VAALRLVLRRIVQIARFPGAGYGPDDAQFKRSLQIAPEASGLSLDATCGIAARVPIVAHERRSIAGISKMPATERFSVRTTTSRSPKVKESNGEESKLYTPEEIADRLGGITLKTLSALIRSRSLATTTLGYAEPSRKGGPRRRIWGMNDSQLEALLIVRNRRNQPADRR
jgi:hypothetical protein